ncbi:hypothetical protein NQ314_000287 [Rhamnusium bicolor]|uniref:Uncharacterized protein n=1 Tax=Rhamnusium bicolor TaxID=1586634 RepID=A0AAV8ZWM9_9CUCU|nr:hypothetical protein NQ314_000287 [Rhamnusium bicolor]
MVALLHSQCIERDNILHNQIKQTTESDRALLLQEIRKNNILSYENFQLQQENEYLQSILKLKRHKSSETVLSETKFIK